MIISFIMTVFNGDIDKIKDSIESVLRQTNNSYELIVIDNGSTDIEVKNFLNKYKYKYKLININKNIGYCGGRQKGIDLSSGELIAFIDSDDTITENYVEIIFSEYDNDVDLYFLPFNMYKYRENKMVFLGKRFTKIKKTGVLPVKKINHSKLKYCAAWTRVISKNFLESNKISFFIDESNTIEDFYYHMVCLSNANYIKMLNEYDLYNYFDWKNSTKDFLDSSATIIEAFKKIKSELNDKHKIKIANNILYGAIKSFSTVQYLKNIVLFNKTFNIFLSSKLFFNQLLRFFFRFIKLCYKKTIKKLFN